MTTTTDPSRIAEQLAERGYAAGIPVLDPAELTRYRAAVLALHDELPVDLRNYFINLHAVLDWADELVRHPRILDVVRGVLGPDLHLWKTKAFVKFPGPAHVPWHQDLPHWNLEPPRAVTVWVALSDVTEDNGCVRVVPGTHLGGSRAAVAAVDDDAMFSAGLQFDVSEEEAARAEPMLLRAGEISLHDGMVVHGSGPNRTAEPRVGIALVYMPADVRQTGAPDHHVVLVSGADRTGGFYPVDARPTGSHQEQLAAARAYFERLRSGEIAYNVR